MPSLLCAHTAIPILSGLGNIKGVLSQPQMDGLMLDIVANVQQGARTSLPNFGINCERVSLMQNCRMSNVIKTAAGLFQLKPVDAPCCNNAHRQRYSSFQ